MTIHFNSLTHCVSHFHGQMDEVFHLHQEALVLQNTSLAIQLLRLYKKVLLTHIELENKLIIRQHEEKVDSPQWPTVLYTEEHDKIQSMLKNLFVRLNQTPVIKYRRWIIEILDYERMFKNVVEHHEEREEKGLLKELDNLLAVSALRELITQCHLTLQQSFDEIEEELKQLAKQLA